MYYRIIQCVYLPVFFFLLSASVQSQSFIPQVEIIGDSTSVYGKEFQVIFPLGWSEEGHFGYILQDLNPLAAMNIRRYAVIIQDMKTDKIIWKSEIEYNFEKHTDADYNFSWENVPQEDFTDTYSLYGPNFFKHVFWSQHKTEILEQLTKFKIQHKGLKLYDVHTLKNENITIKEIKNPVEGECTNGYRIDLNSPGKGSKTIYKYLQNEEEKDPCGVKQATWYRTFTLEGYYRSPFEDRISLIVFEIKNGFEESFEYPFLVGASLEYGFK